MSKISVEFVPLINYIVHQVAVNKLNMYYKTKYFTCNDAEKWAKTTNIIFEEHFIVMYRLNSESDEQNKKVNLFMYHN